MQGIAAGADDCISKPFDRLELRTRVQTITRLNRYRQLIGTREQLTWVMDQSTDGYIIVDEVDVIVYANQQAQLFLGMSSDSTSWIAETFFAWAKRHYRCEPKAAWACWPVVADAAPRLLVIENTAHNGPFRIEVSVMDESTGASRRRIIRLHDVTLQRGLARAV